VVHENFTLKAREREPGRAEVVAENLLNPTFWEDPGTHPHYLRGHQEMCLGKSVLDEELMFGFPAWELYTILSIAVESEEVSVAHDFIYGSLGLLRDHSALLNSLKPDYQLRLEIVYYRYGQYLFGNTGCLSTIVGGGKTSGCGS
jgi:hypothetical protein